MEIEFNITRGFAFVVLIKAYKLLISKIELSNIIYSSVGSKVGNSKNNQLHNIIANSYNALLLGIRHMRIALVVMFFSLCLIYLNVLCCFFVFNIIIYRLKSSMWKGNKQMMFELILMGLILKKVNIFEIHRWNTIRYMSRKQMKCIYLKYLVKYYMYFQIDLFSSLGREG